MNILLLLTEPAAMVSAQKEEAAFSMYKYSAPLLPGPGQETFWGHVAYNIKRLIELEMHCPAWVRCFEFQRLFIAL